jgi:hypothetical protein
MGKNPNAHGKRLVLLLWLLVTFFYFYLSWDYIRKSMNDRAFRDYLEYVVQIAGMEFRPAKEVRELLLIKADELTLPVHGNQILIKGLGPNLDVAVKYQVEIEIPLFERTVFTKEFDHQVKYHQ